jgi:acyl carrier protein
VQGPRYGSIAKLKPEIERIEWSCFMPRMTVERIERILTREVANILSIDPPAITVNTPFRSLGMSSLAFVELLVVIEENLNLKLMETDLKSQDFQTIRSLALRISRME